MLTSIPIRGGIFLPASPVKTLWNPVLQAHKIECDQNKIDVNMRSLSPPVYIGDPVDINSEEHSKLRKYASTLRARPR